MLWSASRDAGRLKLGDLVSADIRKIAIANPKHAPYGKFAVQPLQNAFESIGKRPLEVAATLRVGAWDRFVSVALPLACSGFLAATILAFAHTVGEFGVVLMPGGNIPDKTRVVSMQIYDHVEAMQYGPAHLLAGGMVLFSFLVLLGLYLASGKSWKGGR